MAVQPVIIDKGYVSETVMPSVFEKKISGNLRHNKYTDVRYSNSGRFLLELYSKRSNEWRTWNEKDISCYFYHITICFFRSSRMRRKKG